MTRKSRKISQKTPQEIEKMKIGGKILVQALEKMKQACQPGISTKKVAKIGEDFVYSRGGKCAFLGYGGFPGVACISVNEEVVHTPPSKKILQMGDKVSIDFGVLWEGFNTDACISFFVGGNKKISAEKIKFLQTIKSAMQAGINAARAGKKVIEISIAIEKEMKTNKKMSIVKDLAGHGIGKEVHEAPRIPNFEKKGMGEDIMLPGMTFAIEPIGIVGKSGEIITVDDGFTIASKSGEIGGHFEKTIAITDEEPEIITEWDFFETI